MNKLTAIILLCGHGLIAQELNIKKDQSGLLSMGVRSTIGVFNVENSNTLTKGVGGQIRLQFADRINTEWYMDYMRGNIDNRVNRTDYHIGWSMMYYLSKKLAPPVKPYIIAGHCFDRTEMFETVNDANKAIKNSSAIQAGAGAHFNLSPRFDITVTAQYMFHMGKDLHAHIREDVHFEQTKAAGIEGHLLFNVGINYKLFDLWGKRAN